MPEHLEVFAPTALAGETITVYRCLFMLRGQQNKAHLERFALFRHIAHETLSVFVEDSLAGSCTRRVSECCPKWWPWINGESAEEEIVGDNSSQVLE